MILKECADLFAEHKEWIGSLMPRFVDLLVPFRNFYYYNPKQCGSASIKDVLPALTGKCYEGMRIADGKTANIKYLLMINYLESGREKEAEEIKNNLESYCCLDSEGMILIIDELDKIARG